MSETAQWILALGVAFMLCGVACNIGNGVSPRTLELCADACGSGNVAKVGNDGCVCQGGGAP